MHLPLHVYLGALATLLPGAEVACKCPSSSKPLLDCGAVRLQAKAAVDEAVQAKTEARAARQAHQGEQQGLEARLTKRLAALSQREESVQRREQVLTAWHAHHCIAVA